MSKSKGNILTVSVLKEQGYEPVIYRMFCLQSHYRKPLEFSYEVMDSVKTSYERLKRKIAELKEDGDVDMNLYNEYKAKFIETVGNDLNTASGITLLYDVLKENTNNATKLYIIGDFDKVLSLDLIGDGKENDVDDDMKQYVEEMIAKRAEAKKAKDFALADSIRDELLAKGIVLKDTREGTVWTMQ